MQDGRSDEQLHAAVPSFEPLLSPDGQSCANGSDWRPNPGGGSPAAARPESSVSGGFERRPLYGWLGLALSVMAVLLSLVLLQRPMIFIGALDVGLPLLLAVAGMVLASKAGKPLKWISWITGGLVVLLIVFVVLALASDGGGNSGTEVGSGFGIVASAA